ncbi:class I poly(R)-hydroxyalkanoic acid synthase [Curvibacter sp. CHRR-16]|uniref:PHA/PHB synthase family protein n=1 Tax=Curvibacter sp. CHRR-16 TaxID=2835872 RepID=UPI001BDAD384|nr:class I poly(R)-hydroxyalkanoic acid synthase [Curvibacter sp. CHRR-16]MBT0569207.1 class I poly(R)-hydroxyalkanoic acid synthase [Curvibacter sp. CHRR-16]
MTESTVPPVIAPEQWQALQQQYMAQAMELLRHPLPASSWGDKRFAAPAWDENPLARWAVSLYQLNAKTLQSMVDAMQVDDKTKNRMRFAAEQWAAAASPSNFLPFNAEAMQKALQTQGQSLTQGLQNLLHDVQQGHVSMTDESQFEVGRNVATTEGSVVFQNDYFQLVEYQPLTPTVHERPLLMVPPCINKYYILDLQPANSLVRYALEQGHRTFMLSWRNPDASLAHATWDDYIEQAVIRAIAAVQDISGAEQINTLGFCVGGTMLTTALAVLAARDQHPVASLTLLTTFLDFTNTGVLDVFIDETMVRFRENEMGQGGLLKGQDLASTFSFLRPNELVWNYVVGNYLKGETPPPFDLLYWNSDSTNLPGPFYAWYLRHTYLENNLIKPGHLTVCGEALDLRLVKVPVYLYGSREDHIVPIGGAYASTRVLPGRKRFVQGASGHIAGVINPASKNKRSYWVRTDGKLPASYEQWLQGAQEHAGSWWPDWAHWLHAQGGKAVPAPRKPGKGTRYKVLETAPGSYVKTRS